MKKPPLKILITGILLSLGFSLILIKSGLTGNINAVYSQRIAPWDGYVDYFEVSKDGISFNFLLPESVTPELADGKTFNLDGSTVRSMLPSICYTTGHEPPCGLSAEGTLMITSFSLKHEITGKLTINRVLDLPMPIPDTVTYAKDIITSPITIPFAAKYQK